MSSEWQAELEQCLGYKFKDVNLITEALTHSSHNHEYGDSNHNERMEFLGDAVLELAVSEAVMKLSPSHSEGQLSRIRSSLVSEPSLARAARQLSLGKFVRLGKGEDKSGGRDRESLLADCLEAVIAAIYMDSGFAEANAFIHRALDGLESDAEAWVEQAQHLMKKDYKSRLQEMCQKLLLEAPRYKCIEVSGLDHEKQFKMAAYIQENVLGEASGETKKIASQKVAEQILEKCQFELDKLKNYLADKNIQFDVRLRTQKKKD